MKLSTIYKTPLYIAFTIIFGLNTVVANAEDDFKFSVGAKLLASKWKGDNNSSATEYNQDDDKGGQLGGNISLQKGRFYAGLSLQGGEYTFDGNGPDQVTSTGTVTVTNVKVSRSEFDLIAGYYFWENISLFVDIKNITNEHNKNDYKQNFLGIGFGIAGSWPINKEVSFYGSFGFVTEGDVEANDIKVGTGKTAAFEVGAVFRLSDSHRFNAGLKAQGQEYNFDNGTIQNHDVSGFFVGYNYLFSLN